MTSSFNNGKFELGALTVRLHASHCLLGTLVGVVMPGVWDMRRPESLKGQGCIRRPHLGAEASLRPCSSGRVESLLQHLLAAMLTDRNRCRVGRSMTSLSWWLS